jgi:hypothetical protein
MEDSELGVPKETPGQGAAGAGQGIAPLVPWCPKPAKLVTRNILHSFLELQGSFFYSLDYRASTASIAASDYVTTIRLKTHNW